MIRVLQVLGSTNRGGAETFVMNMFRNINKNKFIFDFLVHTNKLGDYDDEIRKLGGIIYSSVADTEISKISRIVRRYNELLEFFKNHPEYKIIHIHTNSISCLSELIAAKQSGIKVRIVHSHSTSSLNQKAHKRFRFLLKHFTTYQFACGKEAGEWMFGSDFFKLNNHKIIPNAINIDDYLFDIKMRDKVRKELNIENKIVIGHVGRFLAVKNHRFLIEIFNDFLKLHPDSVLVLVGNGELEDDIRRLVEGKNISKYVKFLGVRGDVNRILMGVDCLILPSLYEGLPIITIEAQASGLPIIVSDTVTDECKLIDIVEFKSLNAPAKEWAETIEKSLMKLDKRFQFSYKLETSKYNMVKVISIIEEIYSGTN